MQNSAGFSHISAGAFVPEQLVHYVRAVSGRTPVLCGGRVAYVHAGHAVLVAYPGLEATPDSESERSCWDWSACLPQQSDPVAVAAPPAAAAPSLAASLEMLKEHCSAVTVVAPFLPREAPTNAVVSLDCYWQMELPPQKVGAKLRNMLRRAERELVVAEDVWSSEHDALLRAYCRTRRLGHGVHAVYAALPMYVALGNDAIGGANVCLLSARLRGGGLAGFTLGDLSGLRMAFYMFAFRDAEAPPGTADLLLSRLMERATDFGHERMNLGLGINAGISFFKKKWGARPLAPYIETSWSLESGPRRQGLFASIRRRFFAV